MKSQKWLFSFKYDLVFLLLPVWLIWLTAFLLPASAIHKEVPMWLWVVFVLGVDVSHVWSTLFRTYLDKEEFARHKRLLISAPIIAFSGALTVASISTTLFWSCLAYVAVFHFVKQQYGFMRIYKAKARDFRRKWLSDNVVIYISMLYPMVYWHLNPGRNFEWFIQGDFIQFQFSEAFVHGFNLTGNVFYISILAFWLLEELYFRMKHKASLATGKLVWILTTAGNWFIGIVYFNSDIVFTVTNVVAHGLPYMALVIFYINKKKILGGISISATAQLKTTFTIVAVVLVLALLEEHFWNLLVYQEANGFYLSAGAYFPGISKSVKLVALAVLTVPQLTHYILDGYIWKSNPGNPHIKTILLN